jgi:hypothetical protein
MANVPAQVAAIDKVREYRLLKMYRAKSVCSRKATTRSASAGGATMYPMRRPGNSSFEKEPTMITLELRSRLIKAGMGRPAKRYSLATRPILPLAAPSASIRPRRTLDQKLKLEGDQMSENTTIAIVVTTCACVFGWIVWVIGVNIRRSRSSRHLAEIHARVLDRFSGNPDLIAFLERESGRRYFEALNCYVKAPLNRVLNGIQFGIVIALLGISLIVVRNMQTDEIARNALLLAGVPAMAVGAGFLISSAISHRLTKAGGLLDKK